MKKFFQFVFFAALLGGVAYVLKGIMSSGNDEVSDSGILPQEPVTSLDDAPLGGEISPDLLKILVCPEDKGALDLVDGGQFLLNPRNGYKYPIRNGIPVMLIEEGKKHAQTASANGSANGVASGTAKEAKASN